MISRFAVRGWHGEAFGQSRKTQNRQRLCLRDAILLLLVDAASWNVLTLQLLSGFLEDGPVDLWALRRRPRPSRCHSPAATSSILLTLGQRPERAISQTSPHCISGAEETLDSRDTADILIVRNFKWLGMTAARMNNYNCLSFPHHVPF